MSEDAIIVAIVFGSILGMITIPMLFNLAKKWIDRNRNSYDEEAFDRLAKAFIQYKKESERRFQKLESIIGDDEPTSSTASSSSAELNKTSLHNQIEIEPDEPETKGEEKESSGGNLRNMLKE